MSDLLKEAIADAKAVRETALLNAKAALQEAFTPHLKSMLSAKLKEVEDEEMEGEDELDVEDELGDEEEVPAEEGSYEEDEEFSAEDELGDEEVPEDVPEEEPELEDEEGVIEINGVKYAPVVSEDDDEVDVDDVYVDGGEEEEDELDLEAVVRELEAELSEDEAEEGDPVEEAAEEAEETVDETADEAEETVDEAEETSDDAETVDEEFEIDESLFDDDEAVTEDEEENSDSEGIDEIKNELKEYKEAVVFLKDKLHEVNLLNAKLLFTNKLFKSFSMDNDQKMKVVETFDRAQTIREIKLLYATLAENLNTPKRSKKAVNEGVASKKSGSTKPSKKVITEENEVADRFKKLAGLI